MSNIYTYKIIFDGDGGDGSGTTPSPTAPEQDNQINSKKPTEKKKSDGATAITTTLFQRIGQSAVSFATSNVQRWTGSAVKQNQVNNAMKAIGYAGAIATNPILGTTALMVDVATSLYNYNYELNLQNKENNEMARRLGIANNRSR